jgi:hypothetical protein
VFRRDLSGNTVHGDTGTGKEVGMGIVWTILAVIGLIVVLQYIF